MFESRRNHRTLVFAATFLTTALAAMPAFAGGPGISALFFGLGSFGKINGLDTAVEGNGIEPDLLSDKHLSLEDGGHLFGGGLQITLYSSGGVRGGFALAAFGVEGTRLSHDPLDYDFTVQAQDAWGASADVFIGYELWSGPVRPYLDLVGNFDGVSLQTDLLHPDFGRLGRTQYQGWLFGFGPRAGISIPISEHVFFDAAGTYNIMGLERLRITAGIGFWSR